MNFLEMFHHLKEGKKAARKTWDENEYIWIKDAYVRHSKPHPEFPSSGKDISYVLEQNDIEASDWFLID